MKKQNWNLFALIITLTIAFNACIKDDLPEPDPIDETEFTIVDNGQGVGTTTWEAENTYILDGFIFVNEGQTLTIEPGTVIKGKPGSGVNSSALIVARGAKIIAKGTQDRPIIFTAEADNLDGNINIKTKGLWGGLIILGNGILNSSPGETAIEGIPTNEPRGIFGGNDNEDNSGVLQYISIRHGGTDLGDGDEINGLSLGAVGSQTTIDHIEVISNADDGVEFFGGAPRCKNMIVSFCGDDCYDYDQGYNGFGQFWIAIQDKTEGNTIGEHDGGTNPETAQPYATPHIYNVTYVGRGSDAGKDMLTFVDNAGGHYANSIFVNQSKGVKMEILAGESCYDRFKAQDLEIKNNIFYDVADGTAEGLFKMAFGSGSEANPDAANAEKTFTDYFTEAGNTIYDPGLIYSNDTWQLVPSENVSGNMAITIDPWFEQVNYKGALEPGVPSWAKGWTLISSKGLND